MYVLVATNASTITMKLRMHDTMHAALADFLQGCKNLRLAYVLDRW
jgi:hypothetical protein